MKEAGEGWREERDESGGGGGGGERWRKKGKGRN